ncbi:pyridine nucleotide-disulfide oxidoreductase-domain-containing protein [Gilbertella persicaria]|uniref:pyridine nucleotide-disulfide oxidoreductase-domain-containing protein n=1 Tax=Gilbertella persicaria TaxID=101096 RepID=UPI0022205011|nr:pyridine nucleotide-disulfide oxidoreductase-domain-containing protein [Gilbertella persicaria]KAI8050654.1 pyridine nucleotide-disulfide oxidoreductase-domain-containing protein [Gilbertella persicaria]
MRKSLEVDFSFLLSFVIMFSRSFLNSHKQQFVRLTRQYTTQKTPNAWFGPKLKKLMLYSSVGLGSGGLAYYLAQDPDRFVDVFGAHEHVPQLALYPQRGGAKGLPVATHLLDDTVENEKNKKQRLVILGSGWGAVSVLKNLDKDKYDVVIISENNYFLFTPLLPSATVGTLELRSLIEPVRKIVSRINGHFLEGRAVDIDLDNKYVEVNGVNDDENFYVPYDKLVVAVGATSMTHGVEGIENTNRLKTIQDAIQIRHKVTENVEKACLPTTTPEERKQLLSFVVCGGGPTGVEFAAEMSDWINEDLVKWFPKLIREDISIHIIQSRDHILNTFDSKISDYAEKRFDREHINVITNARVERIDKNEVVYKLKGTGPNEEPVVKTLPYGLCLWSTGIAMTPFAKKLTEKLPEQAHKRVLTTDGYLHLNGLEDQSIYALGDCASIENPKLLEHIMEFFEEADSDQDGSLQFDQFLVACQTMRTRFPLTDQYLTNLERMFRKYDSDKNGVLDFEEMKCMLNDIDKKLTNLPATAQVASQQGAYLAKYLNKLATENSPDELSTKQAVGVFRYNHLGTLAYLGNTAVGDFKWGYQMIGGLWALYLWRSVYWSEQVSMRTRMNLSIDWTKRAIWGRDISTV